MIHRCLSFVALGALALMSTALAGCGEGDGSADAGNRFVVVTGGQSGVYYPTGGAIGRLVRKAGGDLQFDVRTSGGSVANARQLQRGAADFAILQNDIASYARRGVQQFDEPIDNLMGVASLYPEHVQLIAAADAGIDSPAALRDKRVAIGAIGSGTEANALQVLEAVGLTTDELKSVERLKAAESADYLRDGRVDAAFFTFGVGAAAIRDLVERGDVVIVPIGGEARRRLIERHPFYREAVIPADAYGQDEPAADVPTVSVMATLVARGETPAEVVEAVLEAIFENLDEFKAAHARLREVNRERAAEMVLPMHPGAEAFYD